METGEETLRRERDKKAKETDYETGISDVL